jgi:2,5-diketo-D-gluconate reductase A
MSIESQHGYQMPMIGLGTYLCSVEQAETAVTIALRQGYRLIDTAEFYNNHEGIAAAMKKVFPEIKREDIFLVDKLNPWRNFATKEYKSYEEVIESFHRHRKRLETEYIDLFLIHHPYAKAGRLIHYQALVELQRQGYIRNIGVSNYNIHHIEEIKTAGLPLPAVNQIEIHPLCSQVPLIDYLRQHQIIPQAYSSLAPLSSWRADLDRKSSKTAEDVARMDKFLNHLANMSAKHQVSEAQILLKWALQHGYPIIPKVKRRYSYVLIDCIYDWRIEY